MEIDGQEGLVEFGGVTKKVNLTLLGQVSVGDYVLVHAGYAIERIREEEAAETLDVIRQICELETSR
jgi:hydrogenase expression/formation protein HypC